MNLSPAPRVTPYAAAHPCGGFRLLQHVGVATDEAHLSGVLGRGVVVVAERIAMRWGALAEEEVDLAWPGRLMSVSPSYGLAFTPLSRSHSGAGGSRGEIAAPPPPPQSRSKVTKHSKRPLAAGPGLPRVHARRAPLRCGSNKMTYHSLASGSPGRRSARRTPEGGPNRGRAQRREFGEPTERRAKRGRRRRVRRASRAVVRRRPRREDPAASGSVIAR